ncbi:hypothetical protein [Kribbella sp. VKM Ac-2566]|jgi:hypothetical protein|uniref:hypothetical protein n=1 Tax=Kribbella sp. VKM Ac-2566 TaxID=2512218 RepID=UPI0010646041|nr:hypothetical protein [Kribbella sp. VKM Ac-2566]
MEYVVFLAGLAVVLAGLTWFASWAKRHGRGSGVAGALAAHDEAYRTTAHQSHHELRLQAERKSESGSPDDL